MVWTKETIRALRYKVGVSAYQNFSQQNFGKEIGVSRSTVVRLETGERIPTPEEILKLNKLAKEHDFTCEG